MPNRICYVKTCRNRVVFRFPKDAGLRDDWLIAIQRIGDNPKPDHGLCADHFAKDDLITFGYDSGVALTRKRLKRGAIPTLALPKEDLPTNRPKKTYNPNKATSSSQEEDQTMRHCRILRGVPPSCDEVPPLRWIKPGEVSQSDEDEVITGDLDQLNAFDESPSNGNDVKDPLWIDASRSQDEGEGTCSSSDFLPGLIKVKEEVCDYDLEASSTSQTNIKQEGEEDDSSPPEPHYSAEIFSSLAQKILEAKTREVAILELSKKTLLSSISEPENTAEIDYREDERPRSDLRVAYLVEKSLQNIRDPSYNLVKAAKDLRNLEDKAMPPHWSFTVTPRGILLLYANNLGKSTWPVSRCITIQPDMNLDIQVMNAPPPKLYRGPMMCLMDILCAMKTTTSLRICAGLDGKCVSEGYLDPRALAGYEKCGACLKESRRRLRAAPRQRVRNLDPEEESKKASKRAKELVSARQSAAYYKKKLDLAEDQIIKLKTENIRLKKLRDRPHGAAVEKALDCIQKHFLSSDDK